MATDDLFSTPSPPVEGIDYTVEHGRWIFTRTYHLKRGYCCGSGCRECPYRDNTLPYPSMPKEREPPKGG